MADDDSDKGFSVSDRRIKAGEEAEQARESAEKKKESQKEESPPEEKGQNVETGKAGSGERLITGPEEESPGDHAGPLPPVNFTTFLLSLHTSGMINLGLIPDPATNLSTVNLEVARQNIDLLDMLKEKTRGNLTSEEKNLLDNILYELRMAYLEVSKENKE